MKASIASILLLCSTIGMAQAQEANPEAHKTPASLLRNVCDQMRKEILGAYDFKTLDEDLEQVLSSTGIKEHLASIKDLSAKIAVAYKETNALQAQIDDLVRAHKYLDANEAQIKFDTAVPKRDQLSADYGNEVKMVTDLVAKNSLSVSNRYNGWSSEKVISVSKDIPAEDIFDTKINYTRYKYTRIVSGVNFKGEKFQYVSGDQDQIDVNQFIDNLVTTKGCKATYGLR